MGAVLAAARAQKPSDDRGSQVPARLWTLTLKLQGFPHMREAIECECTGCDDCLPCCSVMGALQEYTSEQLYSPRIGSAST